MFFILHLICSLHSCCSPYLCELHVILHCMAIESSIDFVASCGCGLPVNMYYGMSAVIGWGWMQMWTICGCGKNRTHEGLKGTLILI